MCGIVGIYAVSKYVDENLLIQMWDTMFHRGPDDTGLYISNDRRLGLGHRRLSIENDLARTKEVTNALVTSIAQDIIISKR